MMHLLLAVFLLFSLVPDSGALRIKSFGINTLDEIDDLGCDEAQAIIWNDTLAVWECDFAGGDIVLKTVEELRTNDDVLSDDAQLKFNLVRNTTFTIQGVLIYTADTTVPNVSVSFHSPDGSTMTISVIAGEGNVNVAQHLYQISQDPANFDIAGNAFAHLQVSGIIISGDVGGEFAVHWAQQNSNATPTRAVIGSFINFRRFRP